MAWRLFATCWLVYSLHFATNTVREIFPALAIAEHFSFRVDDYARMHPDLFETPGRGWHIGNNLGASMLGAIPYALARPVVDRIVERVNRQRAATGAAPPQYHSPWPKAQLFFQEAWRRGYDVKFALASFLMQSFCMAPLSAASAVLMFLATRRVFGSDRTALWLALLYAFGTPVFFRTGLLNQNLLAGHFTFAGFVALWNPGGLLDGCLARTRSWLGGLCGGAALLMDYSGAPLLLALFVYGLARRERDSLPRAAAYIAGTLPPVALLWLGQWQSFGNFILPAQHWMPPVEFIEKGYQGVQGPQLDLVWLLGFDYRFGLFTSCPLLLLALAAPWMDRGAVRRIPKLELTAVFTIVVVFWVFLSGVNYARLNYNSGVRYIVPAAPLLFLAAAAVLTRLPRWAAYGVTVSAVAQAWCMAMYRDVERGLGVLDPVAQVLVGGFQLPALTVLSRIETGLEYVSRGVSPLPAFVLAGVLIAGIWSPRLFERAEP